MATNPTKASGFICALIPLLSLIYLAIRKPYVEDFNNYRAITNSSVEFVILAIYGYYRCFVTYNDSLSGINSFLPYFVIVLLLASIIVNIVAIVKRPLDECRRKKEEQELKERLFRVKEEEEANKNYMFEMMKEIAKFTHKNGPQVRQAIGGNSFRPEKIELSKSSNSDREYNSTLSIKDVAEKVSEKIIKRPKVGTVSYSHKIDDKKVYTE